MNKTQLRFLMLRVRATVAMFRTDDRVSVGNIDYKVFERGVHARYRRLDSKWGMKFFAFEEQRDETFSWHQLLFDRGIGPEVDHKFTAKCANGRKVYGYLTEHAMTTLAHYQGKDKWDMQDKAEVVAGHGYRLGLEDLHDNNMGIMEDGRILIIDCSFSNGQGTWERNVLNDWSSEIHCSLA
jgi:hypothetical protein